MSDDLPLETLVERLNRVFSDDLEDEGVPFAITLDHWNSPDDIYRLRVGPKNLEDGSWISDLGPMFKDTDELRAFMRGLEYGRDGTVDRKARQL